MLGREPILWTGLIGAAVNLAVGFGLTWTAEQVSLVNTFVLAAVGFAARRKVTPEQDS